MQLPILPFTIIALLALAGCTGDSDDQPETAPVQDDVASSAEPTAPESGTPGRVTPLHMDSEVPRMLSVITSDGAYGEASSITADSVSYAGIGASNRAVELYLNGTFVGTTLSRNDGTWMLDNSDAPLAVGDYTVSLATVGGPDGDHYYPDVFSFRYDPGAPPVPVVTGILDDTNLPGDGITSDQTLIVQGTAEPDRTIEVRINGTLIGDTTSDGSGDWSFDYTDQTLAEGTYLVTARAIGTSDPSSDSAQYEVRIDLSAPSAPVISGVSPDTGTSDSDGILNEDIWTLDGSSEPGATIEIEIDGSVVDTVVADAGGNWQYDQETPLPEGSHTVRVRATDPAGNPSDWSGDFTVTIDQTPPGSVTSLTVQPDTGTAGDGVTASNELTYSGQAPANQYVEVFLDGTSVGSVAVGADGNWSLDASGSPVTEGTYSITAVTSDAAGNESAVFDGGDLTVDASTPAAPQLLGITDDTGVDGDQVTRDPQLLIYGTAEQGVEVEVFQGGVSLGTTTTDAGGDWSYDNSGNVLGDGNYPYTATARDAAGNVSPASASLTVVVDTAIALPVVEAISDDTGTPGDGITSDNALVVSGTAEAGSQVEVFRDGVSAGLTGADGAGNWSFDDTATVLSDGSYSYTAIATDLAGNVSGPSAGFAVTVDASAPAAPAVNGITDDTGANGSDGITSDTTLIFGGTSEANAGVEVFIDGGSIGTTTADGSGNWSYDHTATTLAEGSYTVTAVATDAAGNSSVVSGGFALTVDASVPAAPVVTGITDDTGAAADGITSDTTLFINGTSDTDASIEVFIDGGSIGTTTADGSGNWSYDHTATPLAEGSYTVTAQATDTAGNTSAVSAGFALTVDTSAPAAPAVTAITDDTGTASDGVTSDTTLIFGGTSEANAGVEVLIDGGSIGTTTADGSGNWSYDHTATTLGEGTYTVTAQVTDAAGNTSAVSAGFALTIDTSAPAAPAVTGITDDTGANGSDGITSDTTLIFGGTSEVNAGVEVFIDGGSIGTTTADGSGNWSYDHTGTPLAEGTYTVTVVATDAAGNSSVASGDFSLTVDTSAPTAPAVTGITDDTGANGSDGITSDTALLFSGTSEANASVQVLIDGGSIGTTTADGSGNWSYDHTGTPLTEGSYTITAQATDAAGNTSAVSAGFALIIDTSAPAVPAVTGITDDTGTNGSDGVTSDTTLIFAGTSEADASVEVFIDGGSIGTTTADGSGNWSYDHTGTPLTEGSYTITAQATDAAGNTSAVSGDFALTVDTSAPAAPAVTGITDDTGANGSDGITSDTSLIFAGTSEANAIVEVFIDGGPIGTTTADGSGNWSYDHTATPLAEGSYTVTAQATDAAGNTSAVSAGFALTVDTSAPGAPAVTGITDDTGANGSDGITSDTTLLFIGTSEANASVQVLIDGGSIGTTTADGSGNWSYDHTGTPLTEGSYTITAQATDAAGNTSAVSAGFALTVDTSAPAAPAVTGITDDTSTAGDGVTSDTTLILNGTSEADASVEVFIDGGSIGTTTADGSGNWSYDHTGTTLAEGSYTITAQATDAAGNTSVVSSGFALTVDTSAPAAPAVTGITDDTGTAGDGVTSDTTLVFNGTSEADASVEVFIDGGAIGTTTADGTGNWSYDHTGTALGEGAYVVTAQATDSAGNTSGVSADFNLTLDTTAPSAASLVPADLATGVTFSQNLVFNADETVYVNSGNVVIREFADDSVFESIPIGDPRVTGDGTATLTIDPTSNLAGGTQYYVEIAAGAFRDLADNGFAGYAGNSHWSFTTEDFQLTGSTPADEDTGVALDTSLTFVFNEPGSAGTGNIEIRRVSDGTLYEGIDVATASIAGEGTDTLSFSMSDTLEPNTAYYIEIDAGAIVNNNNVAFAGISGSTTLNFTTVNVSTPTVTNVTSSAVDGTYRAGDTLPLQVTFSETVNVTGTPRLQVDLDGADKYIDYTSGSGTNTLQFDYSVVTGDSTADLAYTSTSALVRSDGSIRSVNQANADLTLVSPGTAGSLSANKNLAIVAADLDMSSFTASDGFRVRGFETADYFGRSLGSGGDINGDGFEDFVVGVSLSDIDAGDAGAAYVIFGKDGATRADLTVDTLAAEDGFLIRGATGADYLGMTVDLSGDLNGDGYDDAVVIASHSDDAVSNAGMVYVIWGKAGSTRADVDVSTLASSDGFRILPHESGDFLGSTIYIAPENAQFLDSGGDFNGDGIHDLVIGHHSSDNDGGDSGLVYVIFGQTGATRSDIDLSAIGSDGFKVTTGGASAELMGQSVQFMGDFNGDGFNDLAIGAPRSDEVAGDAGQAYVVFGHGGPTYNDVNLATMSDTEGFAVTTAEASSWLGGSVASSDINGDGLSDLLIGNVAANESAGDSGSVIAIYGHVAANYPDLSVGSIPVGSGFTIAGEGASNFASHAVEGGGDFNGDGIDDILLSSWVDDEGGGDAGAAWVIYGKTGTSRSDIQLNTLTSSDGFKAIGDVGADYFGRTNAVGDLNGDGFQDLVVSSPLGNQNGADTGEANIIWGRDFLSVVDTDLNGTSGANVMVGTSAAETIVGGGGADRISAGAGDDIIQVADLAFLRIDGGRGTDALELTGSSLSLDLRTVAYDVIQGIEVIDLGGQGNSLTVSKSSLLALSDEARTLYVQGDGNDWVVTDSGESWVANGTVTVNTITYNRYDLDQVSLFVKETLSQPEAPDAPSVDDFSVDTGATGDGITSDTGLVLSGTSGAYYDVEVFQDAVSIGTTTADAAGNWTFDHSGTTLTDGTYNFTAQATNLGSYTSVVSSALSVTVDASISTPVVSGITTDTGTAGDGITSDPTLMINGTSDPADTVEVFRGGSSIGSTTADGSGNWSFDDTGTVLGDGSYTFTAEATDAAGNTSAISAGFGVTIDTSAPGAPAVTGITDDTGASSSDGITSDTNLVFDGTSEANASVEVFIDGGSIGTTTADGSGDWSLDHSGTALAENTYTITARATDAAGNLSAVSAGFDVMVDTSVAAPSVTGITSDTGVAGDGKTNDTTLFFDGTSEANASVEVFIDGGSIGTTTADGSGDWSYDHTGTTLGAGSYSITARATDVAGNLSSLSGAFAVVIDLTAPTVDSLSPLDGATDVPLASDLTINFSKTVSADTGDITIRRSSDDSIFEQISVGDARVSGSGTSSITINPTSDLELGTDYYVQVDSTALVDDVGNHYAGIADATTWNFTSDAPLLLSSSTPADDSTGATLDSDLALTFNRTVYVGTGDVRVRLTSDGTLFEAVSVNSGQVTGGGTTTITITFSDIFASNTDYYVEIDGTAFEDVDGRQYDGIADSTTLNFTTLTASTPTVTGVSSSTSDGTYESGQVIAIDVTFDETVNVTGIPRIQLDLDGQDKFINYSSGTGTSTLTFNYTVTPGDVSADLGYVNASSLIINSGTIRSDSLGSADLTLPDPGTAGSLSASKALVVDAYVLDITGMSAANGFFVRGQNADEEFGSALDGAGDVNGDGYEDFLFSITNYAGAGSAWLIFGKEGITRADIELGSLTSDDGILFTPPAINDYLGAAVAANGDLNGDGFDDIVMASPHELSLDGRIYVIWGKAAIAGLDFSTGWNAADGFRINGDAANEHLTSQRMADTDNGSAANPLPAKLLDASGDFNGDGYDDLLIGHPIQDDHGEDDAGRVWVILGQSGASRSDINLGSLGSQGFYITNTGGLPVDYYLGNHARFIGDYNGDGYNDILIGEIGNGSGRAYVVFGKPGSSFSNIDVSALNGTDGFALTTGVFGSRLASGMDSKDINGDGLTDLVIGQQYANPNGRSDSGKVTVIYGHSNGGPYPDIDVDSISGTDGFAIQGETAGDEFGHAACVGDVDSDGIDDMVLTSRADAEGGSLAGAAWVIYGKSGTARGNIDLATLSSVDGFKIVGDAAGDEFGKYCSLADVNGDGYLDLLFVSPFGDDNASNSGETNIIWGRDFQAKAFGDTTGNADINHIVGTSAADTIDTQGGADTVSAGRGDDISYVEDVGFARVTGARGLDTLAMAMNGLTLDLTTLGYHQLQGVEVIDLSDLNNTLVVSALDVLAMSRERNNLFGSAERFVMVMGGSTDTVSDTAGAGTWTPSGSTTIGAVTYNRYINGGATLYVEDSIMQSGL